MFITFGRRYALALLTILLLAIFLSACQPLDALGDLLTRFTDSLTRMLDALVSSIRFPDFPAFR
jgi:hypothetical protein